MRKDPRPNFFIVGAPKAGTTSLYAYLSAHPEIFMPDSIKEPDYFSHQAIMQQDLYYNTTHITNLKDYLNLFSEVRDEKAIGEASVSYLFYPDTAENIYRFDPQAKIIIILREPISRAFSHYLMDKRLGLIKADFNDIIFKKAKHPRAEMFYQQVVALGQYGEQVRRYLDRFGEDQVKILLYDDLRTAPKDMLVSIFEFLQVDASFEVNFNQVHNAYTAAKNKWVQKAYELHALRTRISEVVPESFKKVLRETFFAEKAKPEMPKEAKDYLRDFYKKDVETISVLIGKDCWDYSSAD